jgi:hypothetical protein
VSGPDDSAPKCSQIRHVSLSEQEKVELAKVDFAGMHQQHSTALGSFNTMLQIVLAIEALPWIAAGTLYKSNSHTPDPSELISNPLMPYVFLLASGIGLIGYMILLYHRLLITRYARALNGYRSLFADSVPVGSFLWTDPKSPPLRDKSGIMLLISVTLGFVNGLYLFLSINSWFGSGWALLVVMVALMAMITWYSRATRDSEISSVHR